MQYVFFDYFIRANTYCWENHDHNQISYYNNLQQMFMLLINVINKKLMCEKFSISKNTYWKVIQKMINSI